MQIPRKECLRGSAFRIQRLGKGRKLFSPLIFGPRMREEVDMDSIYVCIEIEKQIC